MSTFRTSASLLIALAFTLAGCATPVASSKAASTESAPISVTENPAAKGSVVAILTKADWCSICQANGPRVSALLEQGVKDGSYELVVNDITSDESTAKSAAVLTSRGLTEFSAGAAPGSITFVDAHGHRHVAGATVAHKNEEIAALTELAHKRASAP